MVLGNPILVNTNKFADAIKELGSIKPGELKARARVVHAVHVHHRSEQTNVATLVNVRLHTLKALDTIVQYTGSRVHLEVSIGRNARSGPSLLGILRVLKSVVISGQQQIHTKHRNTARYDPASSIKGCRANGHTGTDQKDYSKRAKEES